MIFLLVAAAVIVAAPLGAAVLVTVASHREDSARSLTGRPPGRLAAAARRLLCLRTSASAHTRRSARLLPPRGDSLGQAYPDPPRPRSAADDAPDRTLTLPRS
jgi:hypothetical protein